jgi:hypothetical protein
MKKRVLIFFFLTFISLCAQDRAKTVSDTLTFKGQVSAWANYNFKNKVPLQLGARYLPTLNYGLQFPKDRMLDFEGAVNLFGAVSTHPFDSSSVDGTVKPYRLWARYSTKQSELRIGLQKINFGSATMLRPLMWFDQVDPRDPLKLTDGVWGILGRYYFLSNANVWLWGLYGNNKPRPWSIGTTAKTIPEFGGRFQYPISKGEVAFTYHHRTVNPLNLENTTSVLDNIPENRIGLDGRLDLGIGLWFEGAWTHKSKNIGALTNQEIITVGTDNAFDIGNGLNVVFEQLLFSSDEKAFAFSNPIHFSALSLGYPLGILDNLNAISYYDWKNRASYNFLNWNHKFERVSFFLMAYWNPEKYALPQQGDSGNLFSGKGIQIILVLNH